MSEDYQATSGAEHPITPPPELVEQWRNQAPWDPAPASLEHAASTRQCWIATQAAHWGADQELEACCEYITGPGSWFATPQFRIAELRAARRPKPPSLADQGLAVLDDASDRLDAAHENVLRRALERLQELEGNG